MLTTTSKADVHLHTTYSHGSMKPEELVEYVYNFSSLNLIAITDHNTIQGGLDARKYLNNNPHFRSRLEVIVGAEIKSAEGHILGLFLSSDIDPSKSAIQTIQAIHQQGGIAIAAHPFSHWLAHLGMRGVGSRIRVLPFDAVETRNSSFSEVYSNYLTQFMNRRWQKLPSVGGSDGYTKAMIGRTFTLYDGKTEKDFYFAIKTGRVIAKGIVCSPSVMLKLMLNRYLSLRNKIVGWE